MDPRYEPHCAMCKPLRQAILRNVLGNAFFHDKERTYDPLIWHHGQAGLNYYYLADLNSRDYSPEDQATLRNLWAMALAKPPTDDTKPINKPPSEPPVGLTGTAFANVTNITYTAARMRNGLRPTEDAPFVSAATTGVLHYLPVGERFSLTNGVFVVAHRFHYIGTAIMRDGSATHGHDIYYRQPIDGVEPALGSYGYRPEVGISRRSWNRWRSALEHATDDRWAQMMLELMRWMLTEEGADVVAGRLAHQGVSFVPLTDYTMEL